ncbi:hypothetical protein [Spirosoma lituiforme]
MNTKPASAAEVTPELIDQWKEKHGEISKITVADHSVKFDPHLVPADDEEIEGKTAYLRKPTDKELSFAMSKLPVMLDAGKVLVKSCWLGGDEEIKTDMAMFNSAAMEALQFLEVRQSKMVKL